MARSRGVFITFEGGEGSGKTTQIRLLKEKLERAGHDVITTREPGGTPDAEKIRPLLTKTDGGNWSPLAECLLLFAGRTMHIETLIKPALAEGKIVICDRFTDSTRAYQCSGHGLEFETVERLDRLVTNGFNPDLTLILDLPAEVGLKRSGRRIAREGSGEDRFENLDLIFHMKLRQGYLDIARREPRCRLIDATQGISDVANDVETKVFEYLKS